MPTERRTRATILLPAPTNLGQFLLLDKILTGLTRACGGVTVSSHLPSVFDGWWIDDTTGNTARDENVVIMADAPAPSTNLVVYLERLKRQCQMDFNQDIVWVTINQIERIATDDGVR